MGKDVYEIGVLPPLGDVPPRMHAQLVRPDRYGDPEDFSGIAVYLMSKASSYHTCDLFVIDGGYSSF